MILYLIPFFVTFCAIIKYEICREDDIGKYFIWGGLYLYLTCLIGFRYMVGGDSFVYLNYFNELSTLNGIKLSMDDEYQPLFVLLNYISKIIYPSFTCFQIIHVIILNTCLFWFFYKNAENKFTALFLCLLMFYINFSVEILRESLAVMVFIFNYKNLEENKWFKYLFWTFIAMMFHLSAGFLLILPFLKFLKFNKYYFVILVIIFLSLSQLQFLFIIFENFEKINKKLNDYSEATYGWKSSLLFVITKTIIPLTIFLWAKYKLNVKIKYENLMCIFIILGICAIFNTIIFTRFTNYFLPFYCISLSNQLVPVFRVRMLNPNKLFLSFMCIVIFLSYSYVSFYWPVKYYEKWIPYYSIFSDEAKNGEFIDRDY